MSALSQNISRREELHVLYKKFTWAQIGILAINTEIKGKFWSISQPAGIRWKMHRALLDQKDMLLPDFYLSSGELYLPRKWYSLCEEWKTTQQFGLLERKENVFLLQSPFSKVRDTDSTNLLGYF